MLRRKHNNRSLTYGPITEAASLNSTLLKVGPKQSQGLLVRDYDKAMTYIVQATVNRLRDMRSGRSLFLEPGITDIQSAIALFKEEPPSSPVTQTDLQELGVQLNTSGLLEPLSSGTLGISNQDPRAQDKDFEWGRHQGVPQLPPAVIEELNDSDDPSSEDEDQDGAELRGCGGGAGAAETSGAGPGNNETQAGNLPSGSGARAESQAGETGASSAGLQGQNESVSGQQTSGAGSGKETQAGRASSGLIQTGETSAS